MSTPADPYGAPGPYGSQNAPYGSQNPASSYGQQPPQPFPYGQPHAPSAQGSASPVGPYGQSPAGYGQSTAPYGQGPTPYGQFPASPAQGPASAGPYGQPAAPYGQQHGPAVPSAPYGQGAAPAPAPYGAAPGGAPGYPVQPPPQRLKNYTVSAMVLVILSIPVGLVGFVGILAPFMAVSGIIAGFTAMKREPQRKAFALTAVIIGFVAITIFVVRLIAWVMERA